MPRPPGISLMMGLFHRARARNPPLPLPHVQSLLQQARYFDDLVAQLTAWEVRGWGEARTRARDQLRNLPANQQFVPSPSHGLLPPPVWSPSNTAPFQHSRRLTTHACRPRPFPTPPSLSRPFRVFVSLGFNQLPPPPSPDSVPHERLNPALPHFVCSMQCTSCTAFLTIFANPLPKLIMLANPQPPLLPLQVKLLDTCRNKQEVQAILAPTEDDPSEPVGYALATFDKAFLSHKFVQQIFTEKWGE